MESRWWINVKIFNFSRYNRVYNYTPTLTCSRNIDKFNVSNSIGNGKITYPVGLLTADEVMYAGGREYYSNSTFYLYTSQSWWILSPNDISFNYITVSYYNSSLTYNSSANVYGLRPSVSLASTRWYTN